MRIFGATVGSLAMVIGAVLLSTVALNMMTAADTMSVAAGMGILVLITAAGVALLVKAVQALRARDERANQNGGNGTIVPILIAVVVMATAGCTRVDPGWQGIKVNMLGSDRGVDDMPIVTGRVWYNPYVYNIYEFPTFLQRVIWTGSESEGSDDDESFTFRSAEGFMFTVDVGFGFSFHADQAPMLFEKYRRTAREIMDGPFRDIVRQCFVQSAGQMQGLNILGGGVTELNSSVATCVQDILAEEIAVEYVHMVGQPTVDELVEASINAVIEATQRANEAEEAVRQSEAEARQRIAEANGIAEGIRIEADAKAQAIRIEGEALEQYGQQIVQMRAIEEWNGVMPLVVGGEGGIPFINVPTGAAAR